MSFGKIYYFADFIVLFHFEWHSQHKVDNIGILPSPLTDRQDRYD